MMEQANGIMEAICLYTDQIERYENLSTWFAGFLAACILTVLMFAAVILLKSRAKGRTPLHNGILAGVFLLVPMFVTLYLYTFAMNMRKVALYRGYLGFLEKRWNALCDSQVMLFDNGVMDKFFSFESFPVNGLGPAVMAFFVIAALLCGFGAAIYFMRQLGEGMGKKALKLLIGIIMAVCICFNGLCVYYLSINDFVTTSVVLYCEENFR